jgi:hypothetical protein
MIANESRSELKQSPAVGKKCAVSTRDAKYYISDTSMDVVASRVGIRSTSHPSGSHIAVAG